MDILQYQDCLKCSNHTNKNVIFVQVNQLEDSKQIFYCDTCILYDCHFKTSNYIQCQQVIESSNNSSIVNWPPIDDNSLKIQIRKILTEEKNQNNLISKINEFFDNMRTEINSKIDDCYKQMMSTAEELPQFEDQILETLQEIKLVDSFKSILLNSNTEMNVKERQWREFINEVNQQKQKYTNQIQQMFDEQKYIQGLFDIEKLNKMKTNILQLIEDINLFKKYNKINKYNKSIKNTYFLSDLQLIQSEYEKNDSLNQKINKLKNNSIQIVSSEGSYGSYYSQLILDRNSKYIFRFQFKRNNQNYGGFGIGLVRDETKDINQFYKDKLGCYISFSDSCKGIGSGDGIDKCVKGDLSDIKEINCLELRVCIKDDLLEVADYPNYDHIYAIADEYKSNLQTYENLRLGVFLGNEIEVTLITENVCDNFEY